MKYIKNLIVPVLFLIFAGICFPQSETKAGAKPTASPAGDSSATAPAKQKPKDADDEVIPQAAPNALFPALVARVNDKPILGRDLEQLVRSELASIGNPEWKNLREDYRGQLVMDGLSSLINTKLLYQKAIASGVKVTDLEVQTEMQKITKSFKSDAEMNLALAAQNMDRSALESNLRQTLAVSKYVEENINKKISVTQEEAAKYYSAHPAEFQHPDIVRSSHILIKPAGDTPEQDALAKQRAEALLARVKKGEDFAKLAREYSVDSSASQGGDIGFSTKANLAPEYGAAIFSMPVGEVKLVKTNYGYHIVKVTDKKKEGLSTLDEVKDQLVEFLKDQKAQEELNKVVNQIRDQSKVEIMIPAGQPLKQ